MVSFLRTSHFVDAWFSLIPLSFPINRLVSYFHMKNNIIMAKKSYIDLFGQIHCHFFNQEGNSSFIFYFKNYKIKIH